MRSSSEHPHPTVTVDVVLLAHQDDDTLLLLIQRRHDPFAGQWALPGGFIDFMEDLEDAARRELKEETSLEVAQLQQLGAYGKPGRDPRGHTITVAFTAEVDLQQVLPALKARDDARRAAFHPLSNLPPLAFDHEDIVRDALNQRRASPGRG